MLARGSRPPGGAETAATDVVAGGVVEAVAGLAAVLAVPALLARFVGAEAGMTVRQQVRIASARLLLTIPNALVWERNQHCCVAALDGCVSWVLWCYGEITAVFYRRRASKHGHCCYRHSYIILYIWKLFAGCPRPHYIQQRALARSPQSLSKTKSFSATQN